MVQSTTPPAKRWSPAAIETQAASVQPVPQRHDTAPGPYHQMPGQASYIHTRPRRARRTQQASHKEPLNISTSPHPLADYNRWGVDGHVLGGFVVPKDRGLGQRAILLSEVTSVENSLAAAGWRWAYRDR